MMTRDRHRSPTHPGELLRLDVMPAGFMETSEIAQALGISCPHLHEILATRKPITPELAEQLGQLLGNGPDLWIRMQAAHDDWQATHPGIP
ncbi:HigA family addiction module antitoxin [Komagataeibacter europaeus]|uniref:HigA family addiction module antitoxin n=1 Tax=Komagataeibacter europaeus TaxID=33995 RepID=UPI000237F2C4|nr:HigA family addiction module antitoxin [Komagataeibacter europaeus]